VTDLSSPGTYASGKRAIAEAIARRLQTPRGNLLSDPTYGYDLTAFLDADLGARDIAMITSNAQAECLKDERVAGATVTIALSATGVLVVSIAIDPSVGLPFTFVLSVSQVTVQILQVSS
jgi:phage baseplate assembly protein W